MRQECRECFPRHRHQRKPLVSDPGMHHGTCVTHVLWCMSGSLNPRWRGNVPGIPGACATSNFTYLARGPWNSGFHCTNYSVEIELWTKAAALFIGCSDYEFLAIKLKQYTCMGRSDIVYCICIVSAGSYFWITILLIWYRMAKRNKQYLYQWV